MNNPINWFEIPTSDLERAALGVPGFIALVADSEGNTVGLHAPRS